MPHGWQMTSERGASGAGEGPRGGGVPEEVDVGVLEVGEGTPSWESAGGGPGGVEGTPAPGGVGGLYDVGGKTSPRSLTWTGAARPYESRTMSMPG